MDEDKKEYEISVLFENESNLPDFLKFMNQHGAEVFFESPLRNLNLAYPIKKKIQAFFAYFHFKALPEAIGSISKDLETSSHVLRSLIVTPPFLKPKPSAFVPRTRRVAEPETSPVEHSQPARRPSAPLSNEALEKKIEEILQ